MMWSQLMWAIWFYNNLLNTGGRDWARTILSMISGMYDANECWVAVSFRLDEICVTSRLEPLCQWSVRVWMWIWMSQSRRNYTGIENWKYFPALGLGTRPRFEFRRLH
jgi:hypothetical protein